MARPRATIAAARAAAGAAVSRRGRASTRPRAPSFLSPVAPPPAARPLRAGRRTGFSSPSSHDTPTAAGLGFLSSPASSASPNPMPPRSRPSRLRPTAPKPAARSPLDSPRTAASPPSAAAPAPSPASAAVSSVGDLRRVANLQMEALKRRLDALHSRSHTDLDASLSRASKRFKIQNQACQQLTDEVDSEYKKMSDSIKENAEMIKVKYKQIMSEAQSSTSRVRKVTIPEITKSVEKAIDGLRSRYNISMPV
ncbi:arabinogalactan protein 1-like [Oryza brachyantha]|uniref:arabinogalactan protein 1-like n=1 Tax=Oryza brachyantha TaxID=4533 RepID=UPI001ADA7C93|nr:arabinogalactan protein 1-like [Oryza brachyantha]